MLKDYKIFLNIKSNVFKFALLLLGFSIFTLIKNIDFGQNLSYIGLNDTFFDILKTYLSLHLVYFVYIYVNKSILKDQFLNPINAYITLNILFLLLFPIQNTSFILINFTFLLTLLFNLNIRFNRQPIFNPAAIGIFISYLFFLILNNLNIFSGNIFVSWWGVNPLKGIEPYSLIDICIAIIWILLFIFAIKKNSRIYYGLTFLISSIILQLSISLFNNQFDLISVLFNLLTGNIIFFALVMLTEPKTSPTQKKLQIIFGILASIFYIILINTNFLKDFAILTEIFVILIMNIILFIYKNKNFFHKHDTKNKNKSLK